MGEITLRKALDDYRTVYMPYRNFAERTREEYQNDLEDLVRFLERSGMNHQVLREHEVQISMASVGKPEENGYAERLMRTIKEEEVELSEYNDLEDAREQIGRFLEDVYMTKRIHSALGYATPAEFETLWQARSLSTP